jgi:iron complex outermembrane receptor protein
MSLAAGADVRLFANAGRYERTPTLGERFGLSPALRGNPSLTPEQGWSFDAGARWSPSGQGVVTRAYVEGFAFVRFASQLIAFQRSNFNAATPYNVGTARVAGGELAAGITTDFQPLGAMRLELAATALDPTDTTAARTITNDVLPFRARLVLSPLLELFTEPSSRPLGLDRASWSTRVSYRSSSYADPAGLEVVPEQLVVDTDVALSFLRRALDLRLRLSDVFDARTFDVVGYPLPGRSLHASIEVWW